MSKDNPIVIELDFQLPSDEFIIPFAYNLNKGTYYPLGYTDEMGRIIIHTLPQETPGIITSIFDELYSGGEGKLGISTKLFFHRIRLPNNQPRQNFDPLTIFT